MIDRRNFALGAGALALIGGTLAGCSVHKSAANPQDQARSAIAEAALAELEIASKGRLGAFVLDTGTGRSLGLRHGERFGMCSTFKLSLAAYLLREADAGRIDLDEIISYTQADLIANSPVTSGNLASGSMTIGAMAEATQLTSDNAAANLLLRRIGGPGTLTAFWRELGDRTSRLDRYEPAANLVPREEVRDTVTPEGIARSVARFVVGDVLKPATRNRLVDWMARTETGQRRIRAALPPGWRGGDKTGTGANEDMPNKYNDIAVLYPPDGRAPLVVAGFFEANAFFDGMRAEDEAVLKTLGEVAIRWAN